MARRFEVEKTTALMIALTAEKVAALEGEAQKILVAARKTMGEALVCLEEKVPDAGKFQTLPAVIADGGKFYVEAKGE